MRTVNCIGDRFGRLVVESDAGKNTFGLQIWMCLCDCGCRVVIRQDKLRSGHTRSCGCLQRVRASTANVRHGHAVNGKRSRVFGIWHAMMGRCFDPNNKSFRYYGGRGITVIERWRKFEAFLEDMGQPLPGQSIDRMDTDGNYEPSNCRWVTMKEQARNTRRNAVLEWNGSKRCRLEWAEITGINQGTIKSRLERGWSIEEALTIPPGQKRR